MFYLCRSHTKTVGLVASGHTQRQEPHWSLRCSAAEGGWGKESCI